MRDSNVVTASNVEAAAGRRRAAIFRMRLFQPSETFIYTEALHLERYEACFAGFDQAQGVPVERPYLLARGMAPKAQTAAGRAEPFLQLRGYRPALIHAHFAVDGLFALPIARRLGLPLLVTLHGYDVQTSDRTFLLSGKYPEIASVIGRPRLARQATTFLCVSDAIRRRAIAKGFPEEKLALHYLGVDTARLTPSDREEPGLIVQVGRLIEKKGADYLIRALHALKQQGVDARAVIVGGPDRAGDRLPLLTDLARSLGMENSLTFTGAIPHAETLEWMRRASIIAVPSVTASNGDAEGLPIVVLEAGALGKPIVGFSSSGIPEAVESGKTGLLAPEGDVAQLALALKACLGDQALRLRLGSAAREFIASRFAIRSSVERLERLYDLAIETALRSRDGLAQPEGDETPTRLDAGRSAGSR
jgi:glycosyltransferase involved in cell wall biosynthesis